jgi:transposase-like protein
MARGYAKVTPVDQRWVLLAEWERSGKTIAEFCSVRGIKAATFGVWRREARKAQGTAPLPGIQLMEISERGTLHGRAIEVVLGNGIELRVPPGFERRSLEQVLAVVRAC